mmetsp:Transcript_4025/g.8069  ORF Transcript_4025/g.8069 Transcript_4025/m.8069 type:complete len:430 (+) Transcript_4025:85-1374(+)
MLVLVLSSTIARGLVSVKQRESRGSTCSNLLLACFQKLSVDTQEFFFIGFGKPNHAGVSNHYINGLLYPSKDILLDVRDAVLLTDSSHTWSGLLVSEHGEVGPQVVLNLVVEPAVEEVDNVIAVTEVDRGHDLTEEERTRERTAGIPETVHVVTCMVGHHNREGMQVRKEFSVEQVPDGVREHSLSVNGPAETLLLAQEVSNEVKNTRSKDEVNQEVRTHNDGPEFKTGVKTIVTHGSRNDADGLMWFDAFRHGLAFLAQLGELQLLVGVGGVVGELPSGRHDKDVDVLEDDRKVPFSDILHVFLHEIRVVNFAEVVVMTGVVLDIPSLGHHPVEPIIESTPSRAKSELETRPARLGLGVAVLVATVAGVVGNHSPPRASVERQTHNCHEVDRETHTKQTDRSEGVGPEKHPFEMGNIVRPLLRFKLLS